MPWLVEAFDHHATELLPGLILDQREKVHPFARVVTHNPRQPERPFPRIFHDLADQNASYFGSLDGNPEEHLADGKFGKDVRRLVPAARSLGHFLDVRAHAWRPRNEIARGDKDGSNRGIKPVEHIR